MLLSAYEIIKLITTTKTYKKVNMVWLTLNTNQNLLLIIGITTSHLTLTKKNEK